MIAFGSFHASPPLMRQPGISHGTQGPPARLQADALLLFAWVQSSLETQPLSVLALTGGRSASGATQKPWRQTRLRSAGLPSQSPSVVHWLGSAASRRSEQPAPRSDASTA